LLKKLSIVVMTYFQLINQSKSKQFNMHTIPYYFRRKKTWNRTSDSF